LIAAAPAPASKGAWFVDVTRELGIDYVNETGARGTLEMPEIMGFGCAFLDPDDDGDADIYFTNGSRRFSGGEAPGGPIRNRFYRNDNGHYVDATDWSGLGDPSYGMGIAVGDWSGDGKVDVYVTNEGLDRLFRNRGDGTFEDVTEAAGVHVDGWSSSAEFADLDQDGDLDIYVARYVAHDPAKKCTDPAGRPEYCGPKEFPPVTDVLLRNNGDGTFTDVSEASGIAAEAAAGLGVTIADFDRDGRPDIYVANDAYANFLWINLGDLRFEDDALLMGAAVNVQGMTEAGMGVIAADLDDDLDLDLFMTHLRNESNTLYTFEGPDVGFEDHTAEYDLAAPSLATTGFGLVVFDVELDGDLDFAVANGSVNRGDTWPGCASPPPWDRYAEPNQLYLNQGNGHFALAPEEAGPIGTIEVTRGLAMADIDHDGDLDLLFANTQAAPHLYRNDAPRQGHWLFVRPVKRRGGAVAIGSEVVVKAGGVSRLRLAVADYGYLSSSIPDAHFGLGNATSVDEIDVTWPDGKRERFDGGAVDRSVTLVQGEGGALP
jgi:enediyne biosynthesis protein E4